MAIPRELTDLDSLRPLLCEIESAIEVAGHTEYVVRLFVPHIESVSWTINKRYNDFVVFQSQLAPFGPYTELPSKKTFGNKEREFVAERQNGLQRYLSAVLESLFLSSSKVVKQFLNSGSRMVDITGSALQFISMVFRTDNRFEIAESLAGIGWRVNKEFTTVKCFAEPKQKFVGCWTIYGPDKILSTVEISALLQSFSQIKHSLFFPLTFADARETGCVTVRPLHPSGSLWDNIKNNKMTQQFLQKSARNRVGKCFLVEDIQKIGRQILEALKFFHDNTIPYGNLSSRNVFVEKDGSAHVTDIESGVCGLRSFYWPYILQLRKIKTFEAIDVYCFGHVLFEMAFGRACETSTCDVISSDCPPLVRAVLESILTPEACRGGMPTVSQLLTQPLFSDVVLNFEPVSMKISRKLKESLLAAKETMEASFVNEQKLYHAYVRNKKAYSLQSSEDEKKKRRLQTLKSQISSDIGDTNVYTRTPTPTGKLLEASIPEATVLMPSVPPTSPLPPPPPPPPSSFGGPPPPPPPPSGLGSPPPPPPPPGKSNGPVIQAAPSGGSGGGQERNALLASIRSFKKDNLAPAETEDKSGPYIA